MIEAAGGGGGTNWAALRVDQMWAMIAGQDDTVPRRLVAGWRRSADLVARHIARVERYRSDLATAWPPARSQAAAAHLDRLDALIGSLRETHEAAIANHRALSGAAGALRSVRREMAAIHREHASNQARLAEHAETRRGLELGGGKGGAVVPPSPVAAGRQALLEARARQVMSALSTELAQAQSALARPAPYPPAASSLAATGGFGRATARMPLPEAAPRLSAAPRTGAGPARPDAAGPTRPPAPASPPSAQRAPVAAGAPDASRPGGTPADRRSPANPVLGQRHGTARTTTQRPAVLTPGGVIGALPGRPPTGTGAGTGASAGTSPGTGTGTGTSPGAGTGTNAGAGSGAPSPRVNPVGGLIGSPRPIPADPEPAARSTRRHPDDPWPVATGVDPVISPSPARPEAPGPVIGRPGEHFPADL